MVHVFCHSSSRIFFNHHSLLNINRRAFPSINKFFSNNIHREMEKIIAIGQMCATNDKLSNRQQVQEIIESAAKQKACVSFTFTHKE